MNQSMTPRPLHGVRVLSLAVNVPGPVAAARLHALGAAVTKVEPPAGDPLAAASPEWYQELVAGQEVVTLDLKAEDERARFDALLAETDLLLTSMRPMALERLRLDPSALRPFYPLLCQVAVTGYPAPDGERAGHDLTFQAAAGLVRPPALPRTLVADLAAAERVVGAAVALLFAREREGRGGYTEISIAAAVEDFAAPLRYGLTRPGDVLGGALPLYGLYPAADGWVALAALEPHFISRLVQALELSDIGPESLAAAFRARTAAEWERWADAHDLPIAAVRGEPAVPEPERTVASGGWGTARG
jgi:alpha-methylacyl-CoA racemase